LRFAKYRQIFNYEFNPQFFKQKKGVNLTKTLLRKKKREKNTISNASFKKKKNSARKEMKKKINH
jgi:hypothetical protein